MSKERRLKSLRDILDIDYSKQAGDLDQKLRPLSSLAQLNGNIPLSKGEIEELLNKGEIPGIKTKDEWFTTINAVKQHVQLTSEK